MEGAGSAADSAILGGKFSWGFTARGSCMVMGFQIEIIRYKKFAISIGYCNRNVYVPII